MPQKVWYSFNVKMMYKLFIENEEIDFTPSNEKRKEWWILSRIDRAGEKVQIDVKFVLKNCLGKELQDMGERFYQYTAIDEYTRLRYLWFTNAHDTYASTEFLKRLIKAFPFKIEKVQTDNGFEFTNRLSWNTGENNV